MQSNKENLAGKMTPTERLLAASAHLPYSLVPVQETLTLPISLMCQHIKTPHYLSYYQLSYLASRNRGVLSTLAIQHICEVLGWSYRMVFNRMVKLAKAGLIQKTRINGGRKFEWHFTSVQKTFLASGLAETYATDKKPYDGSDTIKIHRDDLLSFGSVEFKLMLLGVTVRQRAEQRAKIDNMLERWANQLKVGGSFQIRNVDKETGELTYSRGFQEDFERIQASYAKKMQVNWAEVLSEPQPEDKKSRLNLGFTINRTEYQGRAESENSCVVGTGKFYTKVRSAGAAQLDAPAFKDLAITREITQVVGAPRKYFDKQKALRDRQFTLDVKRLAPPVRMIDENQPHTETKVYSAPLSVREAGKLLGLNFATVSRWFSRSSPNSLCTSKKQVLVIAAGKRYDLVRDWETYQAARNIPFDLKNKALYIRSASLFKLRKNGDSVAFAPVDGKMIYPEKNEFVTVLNLKTVRVFNHKVKVKV